jgi:hypothetical protein
MGVESTALTRHRGGQTIDLRYHDEISFSHGMRAQYMALMTLGGVSVITGRYSRIFIAVEIYFG